MNNIIITILLLLTLLLTISCEGTRECEEYYFTEEYKSFACFESGSYWVYKDTAQNVIDSITLISQRITFNPYCNYESNPHEVLYQEFTSSFSSNVKLYVSGYANLDDEMSYNSQPSFSFPLGIFIIPEAENEYNYLLDSLEVNGAIYKNIRVHIEKAPINRHKNTFYWAKNIGLIRKVIQSPSSDSIYNFDLVRYKLN